MVIYAGWNQPFKQHAAAVIPGLGNPADAPKRSRVYATPPPTYTAPVQTPQNGNNAWMWQEKTMDRARPANARVNSR
jgi:hypothetical protein